MRLSPNRVLRSTAWVYLWIFRGTPVYVQLVFWGLFPSICKQLDLGIPFVVQFAHFGSRNSTPRSPSRSSAWRSTSRRTWPRSCAPVQSVGRADRGVGGAGMSWTQTMTRTVLPQAMRVIIPPTGNEVISMLKTTSLVTAVPFSLELYGAQKDIAGVIFEPIPLLLVASTWYLLVTSILMVRQFYLERYYAKGASRQLTARQLKALAAAQVDDAQTQAGDPA